MISIRVRWIAALLLGFVTALFGWRRAAVKEALSAQKAADNEKRLLDVMTAKEIENEVEALPAGALRERSRKWVRGPKGE